MQFELEDLREEAADSIDIIFDDLFAETLSEGKAEDLVELVREVCMHFHTLATTTLLIDASPQYFFYNLCCAAENWRRLLAHLHSQGDALPPSSDNTPLLGAVAAGQWELARALCHLSATARAEEEYEDEFVWAHMLQEFIALPVGRAFPEVLLSRYERVLEEEQPDRLELFQALLVADGNRFFAAFQRVLQSHERETEARAVGFGMSPDKFVAYRFIWFEGLALLRLAERVGLRSDEPFLYCPPLARVAMTMACDNDWALPFGAGAK
ncbi:hypothetical protein BO221_13080 [Archangium sp. Cb G35]|uniref:immunity 49 family protein n=1 Tax=Archangium sp. Cb G35 TaxID=1920190 RepID=UPI000937C216|nr:immunity 49 family protein [Archangium sp. Cb G35]OJT25273.1 hypothetical protein BO221_13080 [Archangium sp. Cb G35]